MGIPMCMRLGADGLWRGGIEHPSSGKEFLGQGKTRKQVESQATLWLEKEFGIKDARLDIEVAGQPLPQGPIEIPEWSPILAVGDKELRTGLITPYTNKNSWLEAFASAWKTITSEDLLVEADGSMIASLRGYTLRERVRDIRRETDMLMRSNGFIGAFEQVQADDGLNYTWLHIAGVQDPFVRPPEAGEGARRFIPGINGYLRGPNGERAIDLPYTKKGGVRAPSKPDTKTPPLNLLPGLRPIEEKEEERLSVPLLNNPIPFNSWDISKKEKRIVQGAMEAFCTWMAINDRDIYLCDGVNTLALVALVVVANFNEVEPPKEYVEALNALDIDEEAIEEFYTPLVDLALA